MGVGIHDGLPRTRSYSRVSVLCVEAHDHLYAPGWALTPWLVRLERISGVRRRPTSSRSFWRCRGAGSP